MKFQIEQVLLVNNKACVFAKSLMNKASFRLSDNSLLGNFEIEKEFDMPRAIDKNGNLRTDYFVFSLRNGQDMEKIKPGDILSLQALT